MKKVILFLRILQSLKKKYFNKVADVKHWQWNDLKHSFHCNYEVTEIISGSDDRGSREPSAKKPKDLSQYIHLHSTAMMMIFLNTIPFLLVTIEERVNNKKATSVNEQRRCICLIVIVVFCFSLPAYFLTLGSRNLVLRVTVMTRGRGEWEYGFSESPNSR